MTKVEIAEVALRGIFYTEHEGGTDAYHLGQCLRLVVGAFISNNLTAVMNNLEVDGTANGFPPLYQSHLNDIKARGLSKLPDQRIERARREIAAERKRSA